MAFAAVAEESGLAQREALVAPSPAEKVGLTSHSCREPLCRAPCLVTLPKAIFITMASPSLLIRRKIAHRQLADFWLGPLLTITPFR